MGIFQQIVAVVAPCLRATIIAKQLSAVIYVMVQFSNQFNFLKLVYFFKTEFIFFKPVYFFLNQFIYQLSEKGFHILGCGEK